jgi:hypothetical protein
VTVGRPVSSLAEYYRGGLRIHAEPGTRWRYTDHGFATLGQIVILPSLLASGLSPTGIGRDTGEG